MAYRTKRTTGFSFDFSEFAFTVPLQIKCAGKYQVHFLFEKKQRGAPAGSEKRFVKTLEKDFEEGLHEVGGKFDVKAMTLSLTGGESEAIAYDTDYTLIGASVERGCGVEPPGANSAWQGSVHVRLSLGQGVAGHSAGALKLDAETITSALYAPAALVPALPMGSGTSLVRDSAGILRQVKAPATLADIITLNTSSYEVRFYAMDAVGAPDAVTGIYTLSGTPTPYVTYKFENPDTGQSTRLKITETRGSVVRVTEFGYDVATATWAFNRGNGLRKESAVETVNGADRTEVITIRDVANTLVSKTAKTHRTYPWGEELISEVLDPDGAALTTTYEFYANASTDGPNYSHLKQRTSPDGSWDRHTYDSLGRTLKTVRPHLNAPASAADTLCRVTENTYTTLADADGDSLAEELTTTVETTLGTETGRSYVVNWSKPVTLGTDTFTRRSAIHCVAAGAAWNAAANLVTETLAYTTAPFSGRARRIIHPDGTATLTTYAVGANGQQTTTSKTGQPNAGLTDIIDGTATVSLTSATGQVISESLTDIASSLTLSAWAATTFDSLGRPTRMDYADGTFTTRNYACCGLESETDRTGATTSYQYDALGRQTHVTRGGITTRTAYDADGRVKSVTRIGKDASEIIQETNTYDLGGRLTQRTDSGNRVTTYAETYSTTTGQTTRTTTTPAGTRIEVTARDGSLLSVTGTAAAPRTYAYGIEGGELFTQEILVGTDEATTEWVKTYTDFAGRSHKTVYADNTTAQSHYNAAGQLARQVDPDGVTTLHAYNARGEQEITALDLDADGVIDYAGTDRITKTINTVATKTVDAATYTVQRTTTTAWETDNADTATTVSTVEQSTDGLRTWQTVRGQSSTTTTVLDGSGGRTLTSTGPDGVKTIQVYSGDRLTSTTVKTAADVQLASVTHSYDEHGRLETSTDARTGATTYTYYADDQLHTVTRPDPDSTRTGDGYDPQTTTYTYDSAGRPATVTQPDGGVVTTTYYPTGQVRKVSGARTYPAEYTYDPQGRMKTLTTWQNQATSAGAAVTTWNYDPQRGFLLNKRYADNTGPSYTYKPSGRLLTRTWARGIVTTYGYSQAGDLSSVNYSDSTPDVTITYDRAGRQRTRTDGSGACTWSYHASGQLQDELYTSGLLSSLSLTRTFDSLSRLGSVSANTATSVLNQIGYSYDAASRLDTVTQGTNTATYFYLTDSPLVGGVVVKQSGNTRLTTTKAYDSLNRLSSISSVPSAASAVSASYSYNSANQRTKLTRETNAYWDFSYDALGQVTSAKKYLSTGTAMLGHDFAYTFDDIGNRKTSTTNSQISNYTPNPLNQYSQRTVPGAIDVMGEAQSDATVTATVGAGLPQPTTRQSDLFYKQAIVENSGSAQYLPVTITGVKNLIGPNGEDAVTEITRTAYVPATPEVFAHDTDGNLTADARWTYTWDAENRLIAMETSPDALTAGVPKQKLEFAYDGQSRRVAKKVYSWSSGSWMLDSSLLFLYDNWNMVAELNGLTGNATVRTYAWGLDLSGSFQGAGGVGGLLFANTHLPSPNSYASAYDGNGNVIAYVDMATGAKSATYEYGAFGETLIADGPAAEAMPFKFSTKYHDAETGLIYYGLRYMRDGRFINRDPAEEDGGVNLYAFVENDGINAFDFLGLWVTAAHSEIADRWLGKNYVLKCCCGDIDVTNTVKNASARVDGFVGIKSLRDWLPNLNPFSKNALWKAQAARNDYKHHLTEPGEDFGVMEQRWNAFIEQKLTEAKQLAGGSSDNCKNIKAAIAAIGQAFHAVSDAHSPMHRDGQEWDGLGQEMATHPIRTLHGHPAGESSKVWRGEDPNYPFSAQDQRNTIDDLDSRLRGTLDQVLQGCKK